MKILRTYLIMMVILPGQPVWGEVAKVDYKGWKDCYKVSNKVVELVIVPQIARIMRYAFLKEENILWENPKLSGIDSDLKLKEWQNYGGYKLWAAPQKIWGWPPDPLLDRGPCKIEILGENGLRLIGMKSPDPGIRFIREIRLSHDTSEVEITQIMENVSAKDIEWGIWEVTQVRPQSRVIFPVSPHGSWWPKKLLEQKQWELENGLLCLTHSGGEGGKLYAIQEEGWLACKLDQYIYLKKFQSFADATFPEGEGNTAVFACPQYIELEVISPLKKLKPAEKYSFTEYWRLFKTSLKPDTNQAFHQFVKKKLADEK